MDNEDLRARATKRVKAKQDFNYYLLIWLAVSLLTTIIWAVTNFGGYFWPGWAIGGMGVAALFQAIGLYGPNRDGITEDKIQAEMRRLGGPPAA